MKPNVFLWLWNGTNSVCASCIKSIYLCFFSMEGGELFQRIQDCKDGAFTERGMMQLRNGLFLEYFLTALFRSSKNCYCLLILIQMLLI